MLHFAEYYDMQTTLDQSFIAKCIIHHSWGDSRNEQ